MKRTALRKQNPAKKKEWELLRDWVLFCTNVWQAREGMRTDVAFCAGCGMFHSWEDMTVDHIIERAKAPEKIWDWTNLQPVSKRCNHPDNKARWVKRTEGADGRPDSLKVFLHYCAQSDFEFGGRRPRIKPKKEWQVV